MKKLITPTVLILCQLLILSSFGRDNIVLMGSNGVGSAKELSDSNRARVISRLEKVGYSKEEATARIGQMTDEEIAYFAQHPDSIRRSGFIILASCIGSSIYSSIANANKKREAYVSHLRGKISELRTEIVLTDSKRMNERTLLSLEQDPAKKAEREVECNQLATEIATKENEIKKLESDIKLIYDKKMKVPNKKDW